MEDIDLYCLYLLVPVVYADGKPIAYTQKSIGAIIDDQDVLELVEVDNWIRRQILDYVGWKYTTPLTVAIFENVIHTFTTLGIEPTGCYLDNNSSNRKEK